MRSSGSLVGAEGGGARFLALLPLTAAWKKSPPHHRQQETNRAPEPAVAAVYSGAAGSCEVDSALSHRWKPSDQPLDTINTVQMILAE